MTTAVAAARGLDAKSFYQSSRDPTIQSKLEKAGNSPTNDLFLVGQQRVNALANLLAVGGGPSVCGVPSARILVEQEGTMLKRGNVVEVARSEQSGHLYKMRVLANAGNAATDVMSWTHVRSDTTINGHLNFNYCLLEAVASAKLGAEQLKA